MRSSSAASSRSAPSSPRAVLARRGALRRPGERLYSGRYLGGKRITEDEAAADRRGDPGRPGTITKLEKKEEREKPQLLYDLTSLQRNANALFGFSARRTLAAAQKLYEEHKAITYPRTNSRFLTSDMIGEIKPTAAHRRPQRRYAGGGAATSPASTSFRSGASSTTSASRTTTRSSRPSSEHDLTKMGPDESRIYDLVAKRFLAVFHPEAVFERTRVETTVEEHVFRTSGRVLLEAGWKSVYGEEAQEARRTRTTRAATSCSRGSSRASRSRRAPSSRSARRRSRRGASREASLLAAMETAGKDIEDAELREAMKDSGIGTPATRASIIERLIQVGYIEREGRALHATEKGVQVISLLGEHPLTSAELTGSWEHRLARIEQGEDTRPAFMSDIVKFTTDTVAELDKLKGVKIERANLGPCPICGRDVIENRKGYSCWSKDDPGCGFVIWKKKANKILPVAVVKELMETRKTAKPVGGLPRPLGPHVQRQARPGAGRGRQVAGRVRRGMGRNASRQPERFGRRERRPSVRNRQHFGPSSVLTRAGPARPGGKALR